MRGEDIRMHHYQNWILDTLMVIESSVWGGAVFSLRFLRRTIYFECFSRWSENAHSLGSLSVQSLTVFGGQCIKLAVSCQVSGFWCECFSGLCYLC